VSSWMHVTKEAQQKVTPACRKSLSVTQGPVLNPASQPVVFSVKPYYVGSLVGVS
jgi:hypothetical protein